MISAKESPESTKQNALIKAPAAAFVPQATSYPLNLHFPNIYIYKKRRLSLIYILIHCYYVKLLALNLLSDQIISE